MALFGSTRRAHAFAARALAHAAGRALERPFGLVGHPYADAAEALELHSTGRARVLEALRQDVERAIGGASFTHGAILYEVLVRPPAGLGERLVADVLERGRPWFARFVARDGDVLLLGAVPWADWP